MADRENEPESILRWLFGAGEGQVLRLIEEILQNPKLGEALSLALRRAMETRGQFDKNIQSVLAALNLPSRADIASLESQIESLQGSLVNLNIKVDRLLADRAPKRGRRRDEPSGPDPEVPWPPAIRPSARPALGDFRLGRGARVPDLRSRSVRAATRSPGRFARKSAGG